MFVTRLVRALGLCAAAAALCLSARTASAQAPAFTLVWQEDVPEHPFRIAVADIAGDGAGRLLMLCEGSKDAVNRCLIVKKWNGTAYTADLIAPLKSPDTRFAVGKFAGDGHPAVIVLGDSFWFYDGKGMVRRRFTMTRADTKMFEKVKPVKATAAGSVAPLTILGTSRTTDGEERVLLWRLMQPMKAYKVDLQSKEDWLVDPVWQPATKDLEWGDFHSSPAYFRAVGIADEISAGGIVGVWNVGKSGTTLLYYVKPGLVTNNVRHDQLVFVDPSQTQLKPVWVSAPADGEILDVTLGDPHGTGAAGFCVLSGDPLPGQKRTLAFYAAN